MQTIAFLFVGERPGGSLQPSDFSSQLPPALRALHIDPAAHSYTNLWTRPDAGALDHLDEADSLAHIRAHAEHGYTIVALGAVVNMRLEIAGIPHLLLIQSVARRKTRKKERYTAHVGAVLGGTDADGRKEGAVCVNWSE